MPSLTLTIMLIVLYLVNGAIFVGLLKAFLYPALPPSSGDLILIFVWPVGVVIVLLYFTVGIPLKFLMDYAFEAFNDHYNQKGK